ncbi:MAG TPA: pyroglutamyl-peptidase I [Chloroflexia bacterium]|nr:pyroglutamyl-peptidase I [Chloroflexia bacterium]
MSNSSKNILLTGYEPFDRFDYNPSGVVAQALDDYQLPNGYRVRGVVLPVDCRKMPVVLAGLYEEYQPILALGLGLAAGESGIRVERVGHNMLNITGIPDNGGNSPHDEPIIAGAPAAYYATYPARQIVAALLEAGIPAYLSEHAGGHLCNQMLFTALHLLAQGAPGAALHCGFLHLPAVPEMAAQVALKEKSRTLMPSMSLELMQKAVETALGQALEALHL